MKRHRQNSHGRIPHGRLTPITRKGRTRKMTRKGGNSHTGALHQRNQPRPTQAQIDRVRRLNPGMRVMNNARRKSSKMTRRPMMRKGALNRGMQDNGYNRRHRRSVMQHWRRVRAPGAANRERYPIPRSKATASKGTYSRHANPEHRAYALGLMRRGGRAWRGVMGVRYSTGINRKKISTRKMNTNGAARPMGVRARPTKMAMGNPNGAAMPQSVRAKPRR